MKMIGESFEKGGDSLRGMYLRSIEDIPKLYAIGLRRANQQVHEIQIKG